ncbi:MAG: VOC family protein [Clostridia bacterium]|nr:VOC family protein [Clostridia bacterium]
MKIRQFGHVAFRCSDLEKSLAFYRDQLGFPEKFRLTYGDYAQAVINGAQQSGQPVNQALVDKFTAKKDRTWIVYLDLGTGSFIELFDREDATELNPPSDKQFNYKHFALEVEDIHKLKEDLIARGVAIDRGPTYGIEGTWQMWTHDPDGNQVEWMQYTDVSMQLIGRK